MLQAIPTYLVCLYAGHYLLQREVMHRKIIVLSMYFFNDVVNSFLVSLLVELHGGCSLWGG